MQAFKTVPALRTGMLASALWFYGYNEVSTMTLKKAVSVATSFVCFIPIPVISIVCAYVVIVYPLFSTLLLNIVPILCHTHTCKCNQQNMVTQLVANTAKRVIVIVDVALVLGESLDFMKLLGCSISIGGAFLY